MNRFMSQRIVSLSMAFNNFNTMRMRRGLNIINMILLDMRGMNGSFKFINVPRHEDEEVARKIGLINF